jgi:osmotically inducible lipoprotein OsmB
MKRIFLAAAAVSLIALAGCGETTGDRALSGAGIGAGIGAVGGLMVGAPLQGAVIGGALGAGAGALTSPSQVNLGRPAWRE